MASFRKRNNTWQYRIRIKNKQTGEWKEESKGGFKTKKEAQLAAAEMELLMKNSNFKSNGTETVGEFFPRWFDTYKRPNLSASTIDLQERVIKNNILPRWKNYKLNEIEYNEYYEWLVELKEDYAVGTIRRINSIFSSAIYSAVHRFKILRENPIMKMEIPGSKIKTKDAVEFFTVEEMEDFLKASGAKVKHSKYQLSTEHYTMFYLMFNTGIRIGECLALEIDDLDLENNRLSITKNVYYPNTGDTNTPIVGPTKNRANRTIEIDEDTTEVLKNYLLNREIIYEAYPNIVKPELPLLFHNTLGKHWRANVVREFFKEVCKRAGVPVLSPHALRHSHAVHLLEAGVDIKSIADRLGHETTKTTTDYYLHITKKTEQNALDLYKKHIKNKGK